MEHTQDTIKRLYPTFPLQPMTEITTAMLKRGHEAAEKCRQSTLNSLFIMSHEAMATLRICKAYKTQEITTIIRLYTD